MAVVAKDLRVKVVKIEGKLFNNKLAGEKEGLCPLGLIRWWSTEYSDLRRGCSTGNHSKRLDSGDKRRWGSKSPGSARKTYGASGGVRCVSGFAIKRFGASTSLHGKTSGLFWFTLASKTGGPLSARYCQGLQWRKAPGATLGVCCVSVCLLKSYSAAKRRNLGLGKRVHIFVLVKGLAVKLAARYRGVSWRGNDRSSPGLGLRDYGGGWSRIVGPSEYQLIAEGGVSWSWNVASTLVVKNAQVKAGIVVGKFFNNKLVGIMEGFIPIGGRRWLRAKYNTSQGGGTIVENNSGIDMHTKVRKGPGSRVAARKIKKRKMWLRGGAYTTLRGLKDCVRTLDKLPGLVGFCLPLRTGEGCKARYQGSKWRKVPGGMLRVGVPGADQRRGGGGQRLSTRRGTQQPRQTSRECSNCWKIIFELLDKYFADSFQSFPGQRPICIIWTLGHLDT